MRPSTPRERAVSYGITTVLAIALALLWLRPWSVSWEGAFPGANDLVWTQAQTEAHGQAGPFGITGHLSWPFGYRPWSHPVLGGLWAVLAWLFSGVAGVPSALALYMCWIASIGINAAAILFLFRTWLGSHLAQIAVVVAAVTAASSFALTRVIQPNVAAYFLIPLAIGVVARWPTASAKARVALAAAIVTASFAASMWWVIVALLIIAPVVAIELVRRQGLLARAALSVGVMLGVGFVGQTLLYQSALHPGAAVTRGPWDSNLYGGHLVDLIISSPALNALIPHLLAVSPGASIGASLVGSTSMLAALGALAVVLCGSPRKLGRAFDTRILSDATVVAVLLFLAGGLGNLQSGLAVLVGMESPARVFSRLIVVISILGLVWAMIGLSTITRKYPAIGTSRQRRIAASSICAVLLLLWYADARQTPPVYPISNSSQPEASAVAFLTATAQPCPVAQLPQEGMPLVRTPPPPGEDAGRYYYRGLIPYLMAPSYSWSIGSWQPEGGSSLSTLTTDLGEADLKYLKAQGFCAVLYDVRLANAARASNTQLEGRDRAANLRADFDSDEYAVFLLSNW